MTATPDRWSKAYRPLRPSALAALSPTLRRRGSASVAGRGSPARPLDGSAVAEVARGPMCLLRRPLTSLAPRVTARISPDIPAAVARDAVRYVWPAYRGALTSLLEDSPLPAWLANPALPTTVFIAEDDQTVPAHGLGSLIGPHIEVVRIPGTRGLPLERPAEIVRAILLHGNTAVSPALGFVTPLEYSYFLEAP